MHKVYNNLPVKKTSNNIVEKTHKQYRSPKGKSPSSDALKTADQSVANTWINTNCTITTIFHVLNCQLSETSSSSEMTK